MTDYTWHGSVKTSVNLKQGANINTGRWTLMGQPPHCGLSIAATYIQQEV